jgi:hypothetical protein
MGFEALQKCLGQNQFKSSTDIGLTTFLLQVRLRASHGSGR